MKILIATSDTTFYNWQMLVQLNNLKKLGYEGDTIYVINAGTVSPQLKAIMESEKVNAEFHIYKDTRIIKEYASSVRPHILEKYYRDHPEMNNETVLYIDPDVIFINQIDFTEMLQGDAWHLSDTRSYIGTPYIKSKSDELLDDMCQIIGVQREAIEAIDENAGGAQYLMKGITADFWKECYIDCEALYYHLRQTESKYNPIHPIQSWCADMWCVLWGAVRMGKEVQINQKLNFAWATDLAEKWDQMNIYHNAGANGQQSGYFKKSNYRTETPFNKQIAVDETNCSFKYLQEIKETETNYPELIW